MRVSSDISSHNPSPDQQEGVLLRQAWSHELRVNMPSIGISSEDRSRSISFGKPTESFAAISSEVSASADSAQTPSEKLLISFKRVLESFSSTGGGHTNATAQFSGHKGATAGLGEWCGLTPSLQGKGNASETREIAAARAKDGTRSPGGTSMHQSLSATDFLDNSKYSSPENLRKFEPMVANLPPEQREQAQKELNRPIAAAKLAAEGGEFANQAKTFIDANPALKKAADLGKHGGRTDGTTTEGDYKALAGNLEKARDAGATAVNEYRKANPKADPQSLQMVTNAGLLRANEPITKCADPERAPGSSKKGGKYTTVEGLKALGSNNPGLSTLLKTSATMFSQPGFADLLDQGGLEGKELAKHSADGDISTRNIEEWIKNQAPTNGGEFARTMSSTATLNATANVNISNLNEDVFENPGLYSGEQKAAVMVKLQKTLESVQAGHDLRKTDKTVEALRAKISQLQQDKGVQAFLDEAIPAKEKTLINSDPGLRKAVSDRYENLASGEVLANDMGADREAATKDKHGKRLQDAKAVDYSDSLRNFSAELELHRDLLGPDTKVTEASEVISKRSDLSEELQRSYQENFAQGGKMYESLKEEDAKPNEVLARVDEQKAAYDTALPGQVTNSSQDVYIDATLAALKTTKAGLSMINDFKEATSGLEDKTSKSITAQDLKDAADKDATASLDGKEMTRGTLGAAGTVYSMSSVSSLLHQGKDAEAGKAIYDSARGGGTAARIGYNVATKTSHTGGELAGKIAGRAVGAIAGRFAGMAAASAVASTVPVIGWIADAAMGIGFGIKAIIDALHKKEDQRAFDNNVDPTLNQFGLPKAH